MKTVWFATFVFFAGALAAVPSGYAQQAHQDVQPQTRIEVAAATPLQEPQASGSQDPVPPEVREAEREIETAARRFRAGARVGIGLDPEVITAGVQARLGPFFNPRFTFRPTAEFGFGEVTSLVALNLETIYQFPGTFRQGRWSPYVGLGPGINFINRGFEENGEFGRNIDFNDFDFEGSLNIVVGMESQSGMFLEMRGTAFSRPQIRLFLGHSF